MHPFDKIFLPERIALFGASENPNSVGSMVLRNLVGAGFRGAVYPIHPTMEAALGVPCHADVRRLPRIPDLAVICASASNVPEIVGQCGEAGIRGAVIVSAGFREAGAEGVALEAALLRRIRELTNGHAVPGKAFNTWRALWFGIAAFEESLHQHIHLENNILFPRAIEG